MWMLLIENVCFILFLFAASINALRKFSICMRFNIRHTGHYIKPPVVLSLFLPLGTFVYVKCACFKCMTLFTTSRSRCFGGVPLHYPFDKFSIYFDLLTKYRYIRRKKQRFRLFFGYISKPYLDDYL